MTGHRLRETLKEKAQEKRDARDLFDAAVLNAVRSMGRPVKATDIAPELPASAYMHASRSGNAGSGFGLNAHQRRDRVKKSLDRWHERGVLVKGGTGTRHTFRVADAEAAG